MKHFMAVPVALLWVAFAQGGIADETESNSATLEKKLHGQWRGGPCMGDWTFGADGNFELKNYSPGGDRFTGQWKVHWDALPPILTFTFKTTDAPDHFKVGQKWEVQLVQLNDQTFAYLRSHDPENPVRCTRRK